MGILSMSCRITGDSPTDTPGSHHPKGGTESSPARSLERVNERGVHYPFVHAAPRRRVDAAAAAGGGGGGRRAARRRRRTDARPLVVGRSPRLVEHVNVLQKRVSVPEAPPLKRRYVHSVR